MARTSDPRPAPATAATATASPPRPRGWRAAAIAAVAVLALAGWPPAAVGAGAAPDAHGATEEVDSPAELLDQPARAWTFTRWASGGPLTQDQLRGKVVLLRWFSPGCRYCGNTLPALETLRKRYAAQGLVVIAVYHPKPVREVTDAEVREAARKLGFHGPLAVDEDWTTLNRWWLMNHPDRNWTSVSFLIDPQGIVRWAQGGGEYHATRDPEHAACDLRHAELERTLRRLLGVAPAAR